MTKILNNMMIVALGLLMVITSCKKDPVEPPKQEPTASSFELIYNKIFATSCALSSCHDGNTGFSHPNLKGAGSFFIYDQVVTDHVHNTEASNAGLSLVKPNDPDSSFLFQKLIYDRSNFQYGSPMPAGGLTLTTGQIEFIRQWIEAGAPRDGHVADSTLLQ